MKTPTQTKPRYSPAIKLLRGGLLSLLFFPLFVHAQSSWENDFGGLFDDPGNWSTGLPPQYNDTAVFNRGGQAIDVMFGMDHTIDTLRMRRGDYRFHIGESTFFISGSQTYATSVGGWSQSGGGSEPDAFGDFPESVRLTIASGILNSRTIGIAHASDSRGTLTAAGESTQIRTQGAVYVGGNNTEARGVGRLNIVGGATVAIGGSLHIQAGSSVNIEVTGNDLLSVGSNLNNNGRIFLAAAPDLDAGTYSPLVDGVTIMGDGEIQAVGGLWNSEAKTFIVAEAVNIAAGQAQVVNVESVQRLEIADQTAGHSVQVAFSSEAEAKTGGKNFNFSAQMNNNPLPGWGRVLQSWDFTTDLKEHISTLLAMNVGPGFQENMLRILHRIEGGEWQEMDLEFVYENGKMSFYVDHFSSYAVVAVPEPRLIVFFFGLVAAAFTLIYRRS